MCVWFSPGSDEVVIIMCRSYYIKKKSNNHISMPTKQVCRGECAVVVVGSFSSVQTLLSCSVIGAFKDLFTRAARVAATPQREDHENKHLMCTFHILSLEGKRLQSCKSPHQRGDSH